MAKLLLVVFAAFLLQVNAAPFFGEGLFSWLKTPTNTVNGAIDSAQGGLEKVGLGGISEFPLKTIQKHVSMPGEIAESPLGFAGKMGKRIIDTPQRLVGQVKGVVSKAGEAADEGAAEGMIGKAHESVHGLVDRSQKRAGEMAGKVTDGINSAVDKNQERFNGVFGKFGKKSQNATDENAAEGIVEKTRTSVNGLVDRSQKRVGEMTGKVTDKMNAVVDKKQARFDGAIGKFGKTAKAAKKTAEEAEGENTAEEIVKDATDLKSLQEDMLNRGAAMKKIINEYYDEQAKSFALNLKEKEQLAAEQAEFNKYHTQAGIDIQKAESMDDAKTIRAEYLKKAQPLYEGIVKKNEEAKCKDTFNAEEKEIVKQFDSPKSLAAEMDRRAGVMINAINKKMQSIQDNSDSSEEDKQDAKDRQAKINAYHTDMLAKMAAGADMKETICLRAQYLNVLLPMFNAIIAGK